MTRFFLAACMFTATLMATPAQASVCKVSGTSCIVQSGEVFHGQVERIAYYDGGIATCEIRESNGQLWRVGSDSNDFVWAIQSAYETGADAEIYMIGTEVRYVTLEAPERPVEVLGTIEMILWDFWSWNNPGLWAY